MAKKPSEIPCTTSDLCERDDCPIKTGCDANCKPDDCICDIDKDCQAEARVCEKDYAGKVRLILGNDAGNVLLCTAEFVMDLVCKTEEILDSCPSAEEGGDGRCPQSEDKPCGCGSQGFDCKSEVVCPKNEDCCGIVKPVCCSDGSEEESKSEDKKEKKEDGDGKGCKSACPLGKEPKEEEKKGHEVCKETCEGMKDEDKKNESKDSSKDSSKDKNEHKHQQKPTQEVKPHKKEEHHSADSKHDDKKKKKEKEKKDKHNKTQERTQFYEDIDENETETTYNSTDEVPSIKTEIISSDTTKITRFTNTSSRMESDSEEFVEEMDICCYKSLDCLTTNKSIHCCMTCPKSKSVLTQPNYKTISCSNTSLETPCKCKHKRRNCLKTSLSLIKEIYRIIQDPYLQQDKSCYVCMSIKQK